METVIRSNKPKNSRLSMICRKHPKHQQSPGVCSICLNEKLSKISSSGSDSSSSRSRTRTRTVVVESSSSSSSVSSLSSSGGSSCSSPVHRRHYGMVDDRRGFSMTFFKSSKNRNKSVLTKSRSVAVITRRRDAETNVDSGDDHKIRKKVGFWSKLLRPLNNKKADHHHSRTLKHMMEAQVH